MSIFWSPTAPARQKPGGIFWWAEAFANALVSLQQPKASLNGFISDLGVLNTSLGKLTVGLVGAEYPTGVLAPSLQKVAPSLNGAEIEPGVLATALQCPGASLNAQEIEQGVLSAALPGKLAAQMSGLQTDAGSINVVMQQLSSALNAFEQPQGVINASLALATAAITGVEFPRGTLAVALQRAIANFSGAETESGSLAASLIQAVASMSGTWTGGPTYASAGGGNAQSTTSTISFTWTHAIESDATMVVIPVIWGTNSQFTSPTLKIGSTVISSNAVDFQYYVVSGTTNNHIMCYYFPLSGTGLAGTTQTFTFTASGSGTKKASANSFTFRNCLSVGAVTTNSGNSAAPTLSSASTADGRVIFNVLAGYSTTAAQFTSYSQTQDYNYARTTTMYAWMAGHATAAATTPFSAAIASEPWGAVGLELTSTPPPVTQNWTTPGTFTSNPIPSSGYVDLVGMGAGGGGSGGATWNGYGGAAGSWVTTTGLVVGVDIKAGSTVTGTVGTHGNGSPSGTLTAGSGTDTTITYTAPDNTTVTLTATGGAGGNGQDSSGAVPGAAPSPTSQNISGIVYQGGAAGASGSGVGGTPGGGGGGSTSSSAGGNGGNGGAWVTTRSS